ncbi:MULTISPECIES: MYPU_1760 family metalloprotease [unclassified Mycoplasma]
MLEEKKKKPSGKKFLLGLSIFAISAGFIATAGYFGYKAVFEKLDGGAIDEGIVPLRNSENDLSKTSLNEDNIPFEIRTSDDALIFNRKTSNSSRELNPNFKVGNLSFVEKPIARKPNGEPVYYLGKEGMLLLNKMFKQRALYGPEINAIKRININVPNDELQEDRTNGAYFPANREMYIFVNKIVENNLKLLNQPVEKRIEIIFGTLMHEYTHHIDNMYNKSIKRGDELANSDLIEYEGDHNYYHIETNNAKFLNEFRKNLNYDNTRDNKLLLRNSQDFLHDQDQLPVYKFYSANELFRIANVKITPLEAKKYEPLDSRRFYFNNNKYQNVSFIEPTNLQSIRYLFSFTELVPREIIKLSLGPNAWFYNSNRSQFENYFYFRKNNRTGELIFNAAGDDILKNIAILRKGNFSNSNELATFASNWVFKDQLENFRSSIYNIRTNEYERPFANVGNSHHKGLFKAYVDLMGWGELISFANYNIQNNDSKNINLGGYFELPQKIIEQKKNNRIKSKLIFVDLNDNNNTLEIDYKLQNYNLTTKKVWNSIYYFDIKDNKQKDYYDESWVYPKLFKDKYQYVSYFAKNIDRNILNKKFKNKKFDVKLWVDLDNNGTYDLNKKDNKEIISLLNDNVWNNSGKKFYARFKNNKRRTTTYRNNRSNFINNLQYELFSINQNNETKKYYYTIKNY